VSDTNPNSSTVILSRDNIYTSISYHSVISLFLPFLLSFTRQHVKLGTFNKTERMETRSLNILMT
jgi:hypothetical protein